MQQKVRSLLPQPIPVTWQTTRERSSNFLRHNLIWMRRKNLKPVPIPAKNDVAVSPVARADITPGYITTNHCPPPKQPLVRQFGHHKDAVVIRQAAAQNTSVGMLNLRDTVCWCCSWWSRYCAPATLHWQSFSLSNCILWQFSSRKSS